MTFGPWQPAVSTSDERELLLRFLHSLREEVARTASGLSEANAGWTPDGKLLPIIGVVHHLTQVESRWIDGRYLQMPIAVDNDEFVVGLDRSVADVVDAYWDRSQRTNEVVRAAPGLDVACLGGRGDPPIPAHVVFGFREPVDLRWVLLHLIEETAHHAGHAESTREMLDGARMRA